MKKTVFVALCLLSASAFALSAGNIAKDTLGVDKAVATGPAYLLKGNVAGVRVLSIDGSSNGALKVNIRGLNTLRGDSQPIWIVDGAILGSAQDRNLDAFFQRGGLDTKGRELPDYTGCSYTSPLNNMAWLNPYEIESIEVIKDMSAAAIYGFQGANGVIIVTTKKPAVGKRHIHWASNVSADFSSQSGDLYRNGITHNHQIRIDGATKSGASYNIGGFIRDNTGIVRRMNSINGGISVGFETKSSKIFWFGLNSFVGVGNGNSVAGTTYIGSPSTTMTARYPNSFEDTLDGWLADYDDTFMNYRSVNSVYFQVNFRPGFYFKTSGGLDLENSNRYIWYGEGTTFGRTYSGAAAILNNNLFNYNLKAELNYSRAFSSDDALEARLGFETIGDDNKQNTMNGTSFNLPFLRAYGLSSSTSRNSIHKFDRKYNTMGGYAAVKWNHAGIAGANAVLRLDKTSRYDKKATFFPAVDAFFDVAKLIGNPEAVSSLILTAGYGSAGREYALPMELADYYIANVPEYDMAASSFYECLNRLISREFNAGVSLGFAEDRFNLSAKFYSKSTDDIFDVLSFGRLTSTSIYWAPIETPDQIQNRSATIVNRGVELDADLALIQNNGVEWNVWGNMAFNSSNVKALGSLDKDTSSKGLVGQSYYATHEIGQPVGSISVNGKIVGSSVPKYLGAFGSTLRVNKWTFGAKFTGVGGFSIVNANKVVQEKRTSLAEADVEKGDYLRLENLSASYIIPFNAKWIRDMKVSLSAHNLFTVTKYSGFNPDVNSYGLYARTNGVDYGSYPFCRSIVLGLSVNF